MEKMRRTKIVCTIGPASASDGVLEGLIRAGMNVARLNFSHGDYAFHRRVIRKIRQLERKLHQPVAILQDLAGPKIRIGAVAGDHVRLQTRRPFVLTTRKILGTELAVSVNFAGLARTVKKGDPILLGDGEIELEAVQIGRDEVRCRIVVGGILGSHKGIHFPQSSLNIRALTARDKQDLAFGIAQKVDMVALSFVRTSEDILYARREIRKRGSSVPIIAKIEKREALDHLDDILESVDGIMVARGDLGLEIAQERIPTVQKMMIRKANHLGKPVITATQMLRSMVWNPRPTRAEVADIANAILDGTDALMLSEETAAGDYPLETVKIMALVAEETERILEPRHLFAGLKRTVPEAISRSAISLAHDLQVKAFLIPTTSGGTARLIARYRPQQPIIAVSPDPQTVKMLCLVWGVQAVPIRGFKSTDEMVRLLQKKAVELGVVKPKDLVAITAGLPLHQAGTTNMITVKRIE
ncbi:MAG: pyruvate kinase [Deltaproteobacteria bacterium]|nr:pyruvate kinase [Deltaproteobacteria bacterium]MBI2533133.1 pyruvate kinase [Deltaproteobacteria bacterium]MBI3064483.1 pyruvate kinase [Deltaproteobacteria bacterium]